MTRLLSKFLLLLTLLSPLTAFADSIAFGGSVSGTNTTGTSDTYSLTTSGTNRILFVGVLTVGASDVVTGVTYAGVSMTRVGVLSGTNTIYLYVLANPASGANNVVVSTNTSVAIYTGASYYTGALQTSTVDSHSTAGFTATTDLNCTTTTVADNTWLVAMGRTETAGGMTAGTNALFRQQFTGSAIFTGLFDTNAAQTPAGSHTLHISTTVDGSNATGCIVASFAPAPTAASTATSIIGIVRALWLW